MTKLHVLTNKSELKTEHLHDKIVIVLDILIATTSIVTALANGCRHIVPVRNFSEAQLLSQQAAFKNYLLSGELNADTLTGFIQPTPLALLAAGMHNEGLIYCTTNGTVAIKDCQTAKKIFVGSLLNTQALVQYLYQHHAQDTILIVCSGSHDQFNVEDFYGAGYFVESFVQFFPNNSLQLSDSAKAAQVFHRGGTALELLNLSRVGQLLNARSWDDEVRFAAQKDIYPVIPAVMENGWIELLAPVQSRH